MSFPEDKDERSPEGAPEGRGTPERGAETPPAGKPSPETPPAGGEGRAQSAPEPSDAPRQPGEPVATPDPGAAAETPRAEPPRDAPEPVPPAEREVGPSEGAPAGSAPPEAGGAPEGAPSEGDAEKPARGPRRRKRASTGPKKWYIVHTYSGHEARAKQALLDRAKSLGLEDFFQEVLIPEETVVEMVKGEKRTSKRKYFPGYILVRMELTDETWHAVRGTPKITGFVGGAKKPPPISDEEVAKMTQQIKEGAAKPKPKIALEEGENVRVVSGPFANFSGFIDEVMEDKEKVRVMVQVFGRATPVVLDYIHVEKA